MTFQPKMIQIDFRKEKFKALKDNLLYIQTITGLDTRNALNIAVTEYANELLRKRNGTQYIPKKKRIANVVKVAESNITEQDTETTITANINLCKELGEYNEEDKTCSIVMYARTDNPYVIAKQTREIPIELEDFETIKDNRYYNVTEKEIETLQDSKSGASLRIEDHDSKAEEA